MSRSALLKYAITLTTYALWISGVAQAETFRLDDRKIQFEVPAGFTLVDTTSTTQKIFLQELSTGRNAVISLETSPQTDLEVDWASLKDTKPYQDDKTSWLKERGGRFLAQLPASPIKQKKKSGQMGYTIGSRYLIGDVSFEEHSYYFHCGDRFYHVKTLVPQDGLNSDQREKLDQSARGLSCE